jgi:hypothetical protein
MSRNKKSEGERQILRTNSDYLPKNINGIAFLIPDTEFSVRQQLSF